MQTPQSEEHDRLLTAPLSFIIDHIIEVHHKFVHREEDSIDNLLQKLISADPNSKRVEGLCLLNRTIKFELLNHMRKEEEVLFPAILNLERAAATRGTKGNLLALKITNRVRLLMLEDEGTSYLLKHYKQTLLDYQPPSQAKLIYDEVCNHIETFEQDLTRHIYVENTILFPKAIVVEQTLLGH